MASIPAPSSISDASYPSALSSSSADHAATAAQLPAPEAAPPAEPDPGLEQIKSVQPDFPTSVVKRVRKGNVEVHFEVEPNGSVSEATVVESSNHRLNEAAVEAIRQWKFKPTPMSHTAAVNLVFDIDKE
ncbi:MAG: energy transducer TonB [Burkholderiaceae bacterium]